MTAQAISASSLICAGRPRRARLMHQTPGCAPADNATEFPQGMHERCSASTGQAMAKGRMLPLPARDLVLECASGELWLTRDGDAEDYILGPGQRLAVGRQDQALVQALRDSRFRLIPA